MGKLVVDGAGRARSRVTGLGKTRLALRSGPEGLLCGGAGGGLLLPAPRTLAPGGWLGWNAIEGCRLVLRETTGATQKWL